MYLTYLDQRQIGQPSRSTLTSQVFWAYVWRFPWRSVWHEWGWSPRSFSPAALLTVVCRRAVRALGFVWLNDLSYHRVRLDENRDVWRRADPREVEQVWSEWGQCHFHLESLWSRETDLHNWSMSSSDLLWHWCSSCLSLSQSLSR